MRGTAVVLAVLLLSVGCSSEPPPYVSRYTPPSEPAPVAAVAVIGDSYTGGSGEGGMRARGWPVLVEALLRRQGILVNTRVGALVGSGYVNRGRNGTVFLDQVARTVNPNDKVVVILGSRNDRVLGSDNDRGYSEELPAAVQQTVTATRAIAPNARLLVIGPPWVNGDPPPDILRVRDAVRDGADGAVFVDPIADEWFVDRPDLIGADGIHPTDAGHAYMAEKIAPLISQQLHLHPNP